MSNLPKIGHSLVFLGPSGVGKSTLLRSALRLEGSGAVLMAPGADEQASYTEFLKEPGFYFGTFDDPEFLPIAGLRKVEGLKLAILTLNAIYQAQKKTLEETGKLKYGVLGLDTISGLSNLAVNVMLHSMRLETAPAAQGKDGAEYYTGIKNAMEQVMRPVRAIRGLGTHVIILSHVSPVEKAPETATGEQTISGSHWPLIPGAFKYALPQFADVTMHGGIDPTVTTDGLRHYMQWMPDPKRPTKSRLGKLGSEAKLPNDWAIIKPLMESAQPH